MHIKLKDLMPKRKLNEGKSIFNKKIDNYYYLSVIERGSSSVEAPSDYEESMIWTLDSKGQLDKPLFQVGVDYSNKFNDLKTKEDVENFIKKMNNDEDEDLDESIDRLDIKPDEPLFSKEEITSMNEAIQSIEFLIGVDVWAKKEFGDIPKRLRQFINLYMTN